MKTTIISILFFLSANFVSAQDFNLSKHFWNDFVGKLGDQDIFMTLYLYESGEIYGSYTFLPAGKKTQLSGHLTGQSIELLEMEYKVDQGIFRGALASDSTDHFSGQFSNNTAENEVAFRLQLSAASWGLPDKRYAEFHGSDDEVEAFAAKVKTAILQKDKTWLAQQLYFPLSVHVKGKKLLVPDKTAFINDYFELIFHSDFIEQLKEIRTTDLWSSNGGLMMGRGQIWLFCTSTSPRYKTNQLRYVIDWIST